MNGNDTFLDINNAHLRVNSGNVQASTFVLDQINIVTSANTASTVNFNNLTKAFNAASNIEVGTANLFVDTTTSNVGIGTDAPAYTLDVRGTANVEILQTTSNIVMNGGTFSLGGHMIPTTHEQYDIGTAERKIRHLFLSDNSLWLGDETRITFSGGKMKFRRRKKNVLPRGLRTIGIAAGHAHETDTRNAALAYAGKTDITEMKLEHWLGYAKTLDATKDISDVFTEDADDYEATAASEAFKEIGDDIFSSHNVAIGKSTAPNYTLDVAGDINFTGTLRKDGAEYGSTASGTGALSLPVGTTAQRPATVAQTTTPGMIRFNNTTYKYEGWGTSNWVDLSIADPPVLYSFTSHTFTHCNGDSRYGPQLSDALSAYGNISPWNNTNFFNITTRGFQLWTVPKTGTYRITARGARGGEESSSTGSYNNTPGSGGAVRADIALTINTQVVFIVGQTPPQSTGNYRSGSGGGATWVLKPGAYTSNDDVYMVAGGGGGAGPRHFNSGTAGHADASSQGTLGGGGTSHWNNNGGGAGWTADGAPSGARGGVRPAGGAMGGTGTTHGGFGGGGSESGDSAGGGAGATGGRAALAYNSTGSNTARGGTSYITTNATNRSFLGTHGLSNGGNVYVELLS
jgi:hypothetical protein